METGARGWGWIGRLQPRTFDRLLVGFLLSIGLINAILDLRFAERAPRFPLGADSRRHLILPLKQQFPPPLAGEG